MSASPDEKSIAFVIHANLREVFEAVQLRRRPLIDYHAELYAFSQEAEMVVQRAGERIDEIEAGLMKVLRPKGITLLDWLYVTEMVRIDPSPILFAEECEFIDTQNELMKDAHLIPFTFDTSQRYTIRTQPAAWRKYNAGRPV